MRYAILLVLMILFAGCAQQQPPAENVSTEQKMQQFQDKIRDLENKYQDLEQKLEYLEQKVDGQNATKPLPAEPKSDSVKFNVTIQNVGKTYSLSPEVVIVHKKLGSLNYLGKTIPPSLEPLAEYGDPLPYSEYIADQENVVGVYLPNKMLAPNESISMIIEVPKDRPRETQLSVMAMIWQSNDGFALADAITLFIENDVPVASLTNAQNYDAGTEENSLPGSGYAGGQPEAGKDNIGNGKPTVPQRPVILHPQFPETLMRVTVAPQ
ncbi:MAG TPA: spondin domain-containing protein [Candidatus Bilamarchaeum sp.]|nr:spondin domain-containing protein [Candidatus Bilamarchaeum sp.]